MRGKIHESNHDPMMRYPEDGHLGTMMETVSTWTWRAGGAELRHSYHVVSMVHTARVLVLVVAARHVDHSGVSRSRGVSLHMMSPEVYLMSRNEVSSTSTVSTTDPEEWW